MTDKTLIIVPLWNQVKYTKEFVSSLYKNTDHTAFDLVLVDNASSDKTPKYLKSITAIHKNIHVITHKVNTGYVGGINAGLKYLDTLREKPKYIIYGNNDVTFTGNWLPKMIHWFDEYENLGGIGPISDNVSGVQHAKWQTNFGETFQANVKSLIGFWLMVRFSVYEKVGKLDESFGMGFSDDIDYSIRIRDTDFNKKVKYCLGVARDTLIFHEASASYKKLHKTPEEYKADLDKKHAILVKKWGEKRVADVMDIKYFHGTVIFSTKEFVSTPFMFSLSRLFNETKKVLKYFNGKSTIPVKTLNEGLESQSDGEWTLCLSDKMMFPANIIERAKEVCDKGKLKVLFIEYGEGGECAVFLYNDIIAKLTQPYFMTGLDFTMFEWFKKQLDEKGITYGSTNGLGVTHTNQEADGTVYISNPHTKNDLTIGVPCVENVHNVFTTSILSHIYRSKSPTKIVMTYNLQVDIARNTIVDNMEGEYLWFIDSDQTFGPDMLKNLISTGEDITTAIVYKKKPPYSPCVYGVDPDKYGYKPYYFPLKERYFYADMCGTGCVVIHKKVFDKVKKPYFEYNEKHGEDIHFFEKVKEAGFNIFVDSRLPIGHTTLVEIGASDFMEHNFPEQANQLHLSSQQ